MRRERCDEDTMGGEWTQRCPRWDVDSQDVFAAPAHVWAGIRAQTVSKDAETPGPVPKENGPSSSTVVSPRRVETTLAFTRNSRALTSVGPFGRILTLAHRCPCRRSPHARPFPDLRTHHRICEVCPRQRIATFTTVAGPGAARSRSDSAFSKEVDHGHHVLHAGLQRQGRNVLA